MAHSIISEAEELLDKEFKVLDKGFVRLVDYVGSDERIVQAARVSYGEGTKTVREDKALIDYLLRHRHCYDEQTEVLTHKGFFNWKEAFERAQNGEDFQVGLWDPKVKSLVYESPLYWTKDFYKGKMYQVCHGGVDLLVTSDHKMFVTTRKWDNEAKRSIWQDTYRLVSASELQHRSMVRYIKTAPYNICERWKGKGFPAHQNSSSLLEFIGFFVGDGYASRLEDSGRNFVVFHLKKLREISFLKKCVKGLSWVVKEEASYEDRYKFTVYAPDIGYIFRQQFYNARAEKSLPEWCLKLHAEDSRYLLQGLRHSDGSEKRGTWVYSTRYEHLADQVQRLCLHAGEAAHYSRQNNDMWTVGILSRMQEPIINQGQTNTWWENYEGHVYCAHTRTGVMVVRRNGKIVLSGNTSPFEQVGFTFHLKMPIFVARQLVRHRTASLNEISGRYSVMRDEFYIPDSEQVRYQAKSNKQGRSSESLPAESTEEIITSLQKEQVSTYESYEKLLESGLARELARINLPVSLYTEMYWQMDLHNLFHFLKLRLDDHAQYEIQVYAEVIADIVKIITPRAFEAFEEHILNGRNFSAKEIEFIKQALDVNTLKTILKESGMRKTRSKEFLKKLDLDTIAPDKL